MKKRMFMALAVALTGVSMVVAAGNGELKIQSETSVQKVHAAEIHQIGVEPIPATGQICWRYRVARRKIPEHWKGCRIRRMFR